MNNKVNWKIFDIDLFDDDQDVSRTQIVTEFKKYDGTPREFALELSKRFGWSGAMCQMVEEWCRAEAETND